VSIFKALHNRPFERIISITALLNATNDLHANFTVEQLRSAKAKLQILLNKSINDDLLVQALTIELAAARQVIFLPSSPLLNHKIMFTKNDIRLWNDLSKIVLQVC